MYSWGPKQNMHLGHSMPDAEDEQDFLVPKRVKSKNLESATFHSVSCGASHVLVIATLTPPPTSASS